MSFLFWFLVALPIYGVVGYPLLVIGLSRLRQPRPVVPPRRGLRVTLLIAAHNEADAIGAKIDNALALRRGPHALDILIVSDGSSDGTAQRVRACRHPAVRLIEIDQHRGKIWALNTALSQIEADVVVFSDANSRLHPEALLELLKHFGDPEVGGVCGRLAVPARRRGWLARAEQLYWAYEDALKQAESRLGGAVSAQGSLYAVRHALLFPLPSAVADDLVTSLRVVASGRRLVFEPRATAEEAVSDDVAREFGRRVRSTERGWRGLMLFPQLLDPFRFGIYALQIASHKVLRRLEPFVLALLLPVSLTLQSAGGVYELAIVLQLAFYGLALLAALVPGVRRIPGVGMPLFFVITHAAMGLGVLRVILGRRSDRWKPVRQAREAS